MAGFDRYLYCYCIIQDPPESVFSDVVAIGNQDSPVYIVSHKGLAVVVSVSPSEKYESTRTNLLAHQRVIEGVMGKYTVLPVRFGTVVSAPAPEEHVRKLIQARSGEFKALLAYMEGKVELGLKGLWRDEKLVYEEILSQNRAIQELCNSLQGKPPQATHFERIRLGKMVKEALEQKKSDEAARVLALLRRIARITVENPVMVDRMVLNAAFLVDKDREEEFDRAMGQLDQGMGERMIFKYVGPVPPYNFVNIIVNWDEILEG